MHGHDIHDEFVCGVVAFCKDNAKTGAPNDAGTHSLRTGKQRRPALPRSPGYLDRPTTPSSNSAALFGEERRLLTGGNSCFRSQTNGRSDSARDLQPISSHSSEAFRRGLRGLRWANDVEIRVECLDKGSRHSDANGNLFGCVWIQHPHTILRGYATRFQTLRAMARISRQLRGLHLG